MPATFVVETGDGLADANSFASVAEADTYFGNLANPAAWTALSDSDKEKFLRIGTAYIENVYGDDFLERRTHMLQALTWPRISMRDRDGFAIAANVIPYLLKTALFEAALRAAQGDDLMPDIDPAVNGGRIKFERVDIGPISEAIQYQGGKSQLKRYPIIESMLEIFTGGDTCRTERG